MKLNEKQQQELEKCVMKFVRFVEKKEESRTYNYAGAFAFGIVTTMSSAKHVMCACCKNWVKDKGCAVEKCSVEELYIDNTLEILNRKMRTFLLTTLKDD